MKTIFRLLLLSLLILAGPAWPEAGTSGWQLAKQQAGVSVWKRVPAGGCIAEFRAETVVSSSLSGLLALIYDLDAAPTWLDHTRRVIALQRDDANRSYTLLLETAMPWPVKDRDAVIAGRWWQDNQTLALYLRGRSVDGVRPEHPDYVRYRVRADWSFIPLAEGRVKVVMEGEAAPGGSLPEWAVNLLIQESPYKTLSGLARVVTQRKYQETRFAGVVEPHSAGEPIAAR